MSEALDVGAVGEVGWEDRTGDQSCPLWLNSSTSLLSSNCLVAAAAALPPPAATVGVAVAVAVAVTGALAAVLVV